MRALFTIAALLAASASPAAAAKPQQPHVSAENVRQLHDFAHCLVKREAGTVRRLLALDYRTKIYDRELRRLAVSQFGCLKSADTMRSARVLLAGALAEELLPSALGGAPLASRIGFDPSRAPVAARDEGEYLGLCMARSMPDKVAALLATAPGGVEENSVVFEMVPGLAPCIKAGSTTRLNALAMRALSALAAYRLVTQPAPAVAPSGN